MTRTLVTGGTRSGKSGVAQSLLPADAAVTYVATGRASDPEMAERIARHRASRPRGWQTVETTDVVAAIAAAAGPVLVDSVGLWVAARMDDDDLWEAGDLDDLAAEAATWFAEVDRDVVVVAEQVGGGLVPTDAGSRRWVDAVGLVTEALSAQADRVVLVVAGRAVDLPAPWGQPAADLPVQESADGDEQADLAAHGDRMVPDGALDMAVNVVEGGPPAHVRRALDAVDVTRYPDPGPARLAVAALTGLSIDHVVLLAGAAEAFWLVPLALRPRHAAVVHPTFTAAEAGLTACGVPVTRVARDADDGWRLHPSRVPDVADLVLVGNPNNPTGTLDDPADIAALCRPGRTTVVDEAFMDFVTDGRSSLAGRVDLPGLVVVRSVTKMWSVPGVRAGYLVADPAIAARIRRRQQPWPLSAHALAALTAAADGEAWRLEAAEGVARRRAAMTTRLGRVPGVTVHDGAANFVLVEVPGGPAVHRALLARGIAVRPSTFPLLPPRFLRVAVRDADAVEQLAQALSEVL
ncbi:bifunctional adenosylcobinamide kinase/adenosylcobinamide-phosphate guanylyltransferase [Euzebya sp.]|uniref:bifunctional adenosylcobinamide kinase/adenosylcobinamide-phosphate guanylyltransferase n=1 Tax=Euzebya sp. TaxID=1971409 RepID=UPI0035150C95